MTTIPSITAALMLQTTWGTRLCLYTLVTLAITHQTMNSLVAAELSQRAIADPTKGSLFYDDFKAGQTVCNGCPCNWPCSERSHCIEPVSCYHQGRLVHRSSFQSCDCLPYYVGECCQVKLCTEGSRLIDGVCRCQNQKYQYGSHCEFAGCVFGGTNVEGKCIDCEKYYTGDYCELMDCINHGTRIEANDTQRCSCREPYYGRNCERIHCDHWGNEDIDRGICHCSILFLGKYCEKINIAAILGFIILFLLVLLTAYVIYRYGPSWYKGGRAYIGKRKARRKYLQQRQRILKQQPNLKLDEEINSNLLVTPEDAETPPDRVEKRSASPVV